MKKSVKREMGDGSIATVLQQYKLHHHVGYDVQSWS